MANEVKTHREPLLKVVKRDDMSGEWLGLCV